MRQQRIRSLRTAINRATPTEGATCACDARGTMVNRRCVPDCACPCDGCVLRRRKRARYHMPKRPLWKDAYRGQCVCDPVATGTKSGGRCLKGCECECPVCARRRQRRLGMTPA